MNIRLLFIMLSLTLFSSIQAWAEVKIVAFGDSLTAGYQLPPDASFPAQLEKALLAKGHKIKMTNAGVSGDTSTGGLARLDWSVPGDTDIVILELGANDALRGINPDQTRKNIDAMLQKLKAKKVAVLLVGMQTPRNMDQEYINKFDPIFPELAKKHEVLLYPFFLDGVALKPELNLADGMHPNAKGIAVIVKKIIPYVEKLLVKAKMQ